MAAAAALACAVPAPALAPSASLAAAGMETIMQDDALLLHRPPAEVAATLDTMVGLGVDRVRATAVWSEIAPASDARQRPAFEAGDPGAYPARAWDRLDALVRLATARGLALDLDGALRQGRRGRAFGSWQTGLRREDGRPKPAFETFRTSLWATGRTVWGHLRPARAPLEVRVEARAPGRGGWRAVARARTDHRGFFTVRTPAAPRAAHRVRWARAGGWHGGRVLRAERP